MNAASRSRRAQARWRLTHPILRLVLQAAAVGAAAVAAFAFLTTGSEINETAASVLVAVVFGVATVLQVRHTQRRQHTIELITAFQSTEVLAAADTWMANRIMTRREIETDITLGDGGAHLITMLDYYEFLSTLALRGNVDVRLLLGLRGGTMMRAYDISRNYIRYRRRIVGPELYGAFEVFVEEFSRRSGHPFRDRVISVADAGDEVISVADAGADPTAPSDRRPGQDRPTEDAEEADP